MPHKRIAIIIAPRDFQDHEFSAPYKHFKEKGYIIDVYSTQKGIAKGKFGTIFEVTNELSALNVEYYDAIVYVGGPGTPSVRSDKHAQMIARNAFEKGKIIAAICWSPTILALAHVLKGRNATVWDGMDNEFGMRTSELLEKQGAHYTADALTIDDNIITANGLQTAAICGPGERIIYFLLIERAT